MWLRLKKALQKKIGDFLGFDLEPNYKNVNGIGNLFLLIAGLDGCGMELISLEHT
jgi:hypothetical protein